ncbi:antitoxin Xre/MbcA/ParS toxin-binding domain-containing protein [Autumnicola psychrophila]|uniref:Antitoxin Xre/MbcA/ParS toxin-binding domain-containing protein n=1 Tax=Autumnicola psychrophila TaxID=3075592 RepID=A0ABU3DTL0_9FLAO|nr:antitoxin Xre/MbcA/ParS toxin-binding domain-containing protein [Zunongwangia sp. F225]MDT0687062.1 antitoxin Xre/MbcA/ParS toxin-binding domain-containing protein [Zunongwangia sp. F225]
MAIFDLDRLIFYKPTLNKSILFIVYLHLYPRNYTIMAVEAISKKERKRADLDKFSPSWVVLNIKDAPEFKMELIERIRKGVKKTDWKQLLHDTGSTEKEFENILPASISSMQKRSVYGKETSERIYELARLFGLGYEVFDSKEDFKQWLITPSKTLGDKIPFELLDSSFGFEMVENEIVRIQYNVYS